MSSNKLQVHPIIKPTEIDNEVETKITENKLWFQIRPLQENESHREIPTSNLGAWFGQGLDDMVNKEAHDKLNTKVFDLEVQIYSMNQRMNKLIDELKMDRLKIDSYEARFLCVICFESPRNVLFKPCVHIACCGECGNKVNQCPICRKPIKEKIQHFPI